MTRHFRARMLIAFCAMGLGAAAFVAACGSSEKDDTKGNAKNPQPTASPTPKAPAAPKEGWVYDDRDRPKKPGSADQIPQGEDDVGTGCTANMTIVSSLEPAVGNRVPTYFRARVDPSCADGQKVAVLTLVSKPKLDLEGFLCERKGENNFECKTNALRVEPDGEIKIRVTFTSPLGADDFSNVSARIELKPLSPPAPTPSPTPTPRAG